MNNTLKLYSPSNMSSSTSCTRRLSLADGDRSINVGESLKEISDIEELKLAVRAMCRAAQFALPWNQSYNAIEGFLQSSDYARADLSGRPNRAALLTDFINYALGLNAQAWQQKEDFRSSGELKTLWSEWFSSRPASLLSSQLDGSNNGQTNRRGGGNRGGRFRQPSSPASQLSGTAPPYPPPSAGGTGNRQLFCRAFNAGTCPHPPNMCKLRSGTLLHHLCDGYNTLGALCKLPHPRIYHK
jgi:hypothetical protein